MRLSSSDNLYFKYYNILISQVDCRVLSERVIEKSIHELLMEEIRNSRFFLKKVI